MKEALWKEIRCDSSSEAEIDAALNELKECKSEEEMDINIYIVNICIVTRWNPPVHFIERAASEFKQLRFELYFAEYYMDFSGWLIYEDGELVQEDIGPCIIEDIE